MDKKTIQNIIYQQRWVLGMKDHMAATDEAIAEAIYREIGKLEPKVTDNLLSSPGWAGILNKHVSGDTDTKTKEES